MPGFLPFSNTSWREETNGWWKWKVSHFLIHCFSETSELTYKTCALRKIGKDPFKDFSFCSLMFQDACCMTAHMSWFLQGAFHAQKQRRRNSFCGNERATRGWPKCFMSFSFELPSLVHLEKSALQKFPVELFPLLNRATQHIIPSKPEVLLPSLLLQR